MINKVINTVIKPDFIAYDINYLNEEARTFFKDRGIYLISWTIKTKEELKKARNLSDGIIFENVDILD